MGRHSQLWLKAQRAARLLPSVGRILVLRGGESKERDISLLSGKFVVEALRRLGADSVDGVVDRWSDVHRLITAFRPDKVFSLLHGKGGEDGAVQGVLEMAGVPYVGSGVLASALCMNKQITKTICSAYGLPSPWSCPLEDWRGTSYPVIVKPIDEGSSVGLHIVRSPTEMESICRRINARERWMAESFIAGREVTVGILGEHALPLIEVVPAGGIYDYYAKYEADDTRFICPPDAMDYALQERIQKHAMEAFNAVGARHWGRVDFMLDEQNEPLLLEINTIPGMTDHSLIPAAARQTGLGFDTLTALLATM